MPNLGCRRAESPSWFDVSQKNCTRRDAWVDTLLWWSCQSLVAHSCGLLNHTNSFCRGMFKLNAKFDADSLLYSLSHFGCNGRTVHMLTQQCLPSPLTSTVKLSLPTHAHSSPLSLAAMLHWCHANCSCYINSGWAFPHRPHTCLCTESSWKGGPIVHLACPLMNSWKQRQKKWSGTHSRWAVAMERSLKFCVLS